MRSGQLGGTGCGTGGTRWIDGQLGVRVLVDWSTKRALTNVYSCPNLDARQAGIRGDGAVHDQGLRRDERCRDPGEGGGEQREPVLLFQDERRFVAGRARA